jgi:hypothetical protein
MSATPAASGRARAIPFARCALDVDGTLSFDVERRWLVDRSGRGHAAAAHWTACVRSAMGKCLISPGTIQPNAVTKWRI